MYRVSVCDRHNPGDRPLSGIGLPGFGLGLASGLSVSGFLFSLFVTEEVPTKFRGGNDGAPDPLLPRAGPPPSQSLRQREQLRKLQSNSHSPAISEFICDITESRRFLPTPSCQLPEFPPPFLPCVTNHGHIPQQFTNL